MKLDFPGQIKKKYLNIKFNENPSHGSRGVPCGWMDGWTDVIEFTVVLCNFANVPKKLKRQYTGARYTAF